MASVSFILSSMLAATTWTDRDLPGWICLPYSSIYCSTCCEFLALLGIGRLGVEIGKARTAALPIQPGWEAKQLPVPLRRSAARIEPDS